MVVIVPESDAGAIASALEDAGETVHRIGRIEAGQRGCTVNGANNSWSATHNA
jgi:phosphoribosylformylglycinamidine cyclo-ligase